LAGLGDLNGDGIGDLVVGSGVNYALVLSGVDGSLIWTLTSPSTPVRFGEVVGGGGDVDGDGIPDVIVGDIYSSFGVRSGGAASVFSGATGLLLYEFGSTRKNAFFGAAVTIPGDIDLDGFDDVLIGAPRDDRTPTGYGYAVVYSGKDGTILLSFEPFEGNSYTHYPLDWALGASLRGVGDTNGDGFVDLMIGAPNYVDGVGIGSALIYSGRDGSLLYHIQDLSNFASSGFASALVPAGDLDADGLTDFIVTQPTEDDGSNANVGGVSAWKGHEFYVDARARVATSQVNVTVTPGQGIAGNPYALFLLGINGTPTFTLLSVGVLDAFGRRVIDAQVPFGVGANTLELQAFTLDANGKLLPSGVETFLTQ